MSLWLSSGDESTDVGFHGTCTEPVLREGHRAVLPDQIRTVCSWAIGTCMFVCVCVGVGVGVGVWV